MINRVVLTGRLTKDPELRYTQNGVATANFNLAVDRRYKSQNGDREADFVNCIVWRKSAENFSNFFHKGSLVGIEGRIQTRNYENQQGQRVYVTEVVVEDFTFLEPMNRNNQQSGSYSNGYQPQPQGQGRPQNNQQRQPPQQGQYGHQNQGYSNPNNGVDGIEISDADLPF
ncbi:MULTISPECIES: single-stranded DNA-binding protein [Lactobacillaceae]|uniref:single-stranded DNA-binding protein n=1 Tax=Lactobacillaceae TaxID=33958 RepID=UPI0014563E19|nr:single-stranded DNA-binding protein [Lactobacillus sp. HBUAS51381]NLR08694.1 single-stranded DNA-binding protein [Lactobacillus sp. HBUAS51381]